MNIRERIISKVVVDPVTGCWNSILVPGSNGYTAMRLGSRNNKTALHRASYEAFVSPIPEGLHVCHRCDNKVCANPDHLFLGTRTDNMMDMSLKGRGRKSAAKLTLEQMKALVNTGMSQAKIGELAGISQTRVSQMLNPDFIKNHRERMRIRRSLCQQKQVQPPS